MRGLLVLAGVVLSLLGVAATFVPFATGSDRLEATSPTWWDTFGFFGPGVGFAGLLLVWAAWLSAKRPGRAKLRTYGVRMGLLGLALMMGPVLVGVVIDAASGAEGRFLALAAAIYLGEPGACLLAASLVLFALSGEFS